jgi:hypothetical protein
VAFDAGGIILTLSTNFTALSLAEKHETRPSALKMNKYKETAMLGSASSWDKVTLSAFGVDFKSTEITSLDNLIDSHWYDFNSEGNGFAECNALTTTG